MISPLHFFSEISGLKGARAAGLENWVGSSSIWVQSLLDLAIVGRDVNHGETDVTDDC